MYSRESRKFHLNLKQSNNKIGQANQCGATFITSASFKSRLVFYIHSIHKKNQCSNIYKQDVEGIQNMSGAYLIVLVYIK